MLRWHLSRAIPLHDAEGRIVRWFGTNTDVHDQKLAAQEYTRLLASEQHLRREAEAASRAKDDFLAVVSHELRTPLSVILNCAQLLQGGLAPEKQPAVVQRIVRNAELQAKLVNDILDVSRIIAGKLRVEARSVDMSDVAHQALDEIRPAAKEKGVELLRFEPTPGAGVRGDPVRLVQVIGNLLSNAVKFTPAGKKVGVQVRATSEHVDVIVRDEGVGITPEFLPRLFQRFTQADASSTRKQSGLGLGLSIVRELLDLQGGQAFVHSDGPDRGSTFTVRMPRLSTASPPIEDRSEAESETRPAPVPLIGSRLLVVDDEPDIRATLADMLLSCGATVTTAASVSEALRAFRLDTPDVVVSDIAMPRGGWLCAHRDDSRPTSPGWAHARARAHGLREYQRPGARPRRWI